MVRTSCKPKTICPNGATKYVSKPSTSKDTMNKEERIELRKLSEKLPQALKGNINKDPQMIIHNASHYIQHLLNTVNARIQNGTLPADTLNKVFNGPVPVQNPLQSRIEKNEQKRRKVKLNRRK